MLKSIFMESSETLGLLYNRYHKIPGIVDKFLNDIEKAVEYGTKEGIPDKSKFNLSETLTQFRQDVEMNVKSPDPINASDVKSQKNKVKKVKDEIEKSLDKLAKLKGSAKFGDNVIKGIIVKPKVYHNTTDEENHMKVNAYMREIGRCMDWAEKTILDVMNLADQDMNILSLVNKVYFKKVFEGVEEQEIEDILDCDASSIYQESSYLSYNAPDDANEYNVLDSNHNDEEYFPVFNIIASYDPSKFNNSESEQKRMITIGKVIKGLTHGDVYSHALFSFDTSFKTIYHFKAPGLITSNIDTDDDFTITNSIYVNVSFVTKSELDIIKNEVNRTINGANNGKYDTIQIINQLLGKPKHVDKSMICSTFVGYLLSCGNLKNVHRDYSLIRPEDITLLPRSFYVINFKDRDDFHARHQEFEDRVNKIYQDNIDEIREYNNILPKIIIKGKMKEEKIDMKNVSDVNSFYRWASMKSLR